jgi:hypothetical protein
LFLGESIDLSEREQKQGHAESHGALPNGG